MNLGIAGRYFHPLAESAKHGLAVNAFATIESVNGFQQLRTGMSQILRDTAPIKP